MDLHSIAVVYHTFASVVPDVPRPTITEKGKEYRITCA